MTSSGGGGKRTDMLARSRFDAVEPTLVGGKRELIDFATVFEKPVRALPMPGVAAGDVGRADNAGNSDPAQWTRIWGAVVHRAGVPDHDIPRFKFGVDNSIFLDQPRYLVARKFWMNRIAVAHMLDDLPSMGAGQQLQASVLLSRRIDGGPEIKRLGVTVPPEAIILMPRRSCPVLAGFRKMAANLRRRSSPRKEPARESTGSLR